MYEIWDFTKPTFKSFMSFETLNSNNSTRTLYVINLESKNSIRIVIKFNNRDVVMNQIFE